MTVIQATNLVTEHIRRQSESKADVDHRLQYHKGSEND